MGKLGIAQGLALLPARALLILLAIACRVNHALSQVGGLLLAQEGDLLDPAQRVLIDVHRLVGLLTCLQGRGLGRHCDD